MFILSFMLLVITLLMLLASMIRPGISKKRGKTFRRKDLAIGFGIITVLFFVLCLITAPTNKRVNVESLSKDSSTTTSTRSKPEAKTNPPSNTKTSTGKSTPSGNSSVEISGFGALQADWDTSHTVDARYDNSYNPSPNLGDDNGNTFNDEYYAVNMIGGRAINYQMRFPHNQSISTSMNQSLHEFPSDTKVLWQQTINADPSQGCYVVEVNSPTLAQELGGDGDANIELGTEPSVSNNQTQFDPSNIDTAILSNLIDAKTPADFTGC